MKFTCSQSDLNTNLSLVSRAVSSRPTHPILGNVLFVADLEQGLISLTAFDLSLGIRTSFNATIEEEGTITLPAKLLNDIVSRLPEGEITITLEPEEDEEDQEHTKVSIESVSGRFQLRGMKADDFPELPTIANVDPLKLPISALTEGLKGSLFAASTDETKQVLTGVHFAGQQDSLEFAATDGHRLAVVQTPTQETTEEEQTPPEPSSNLEGFAITIPARALRELERIMGMHKETDAITLYVDEGQVIFELGSQRLTSRKLEGAYPNYQQLIPRQFSRSATLERKRLLSSLERVALLADQKNNLVKFTLSSEKGQLILSVESQDLGSARESIPAEIIGESGEIAFNVKYLMDGLKALPASDIQMQLNQEKQPVIFTPLGGLKMTYLVMPVQIRE
ncbi:DNA polymerase III, beta subunit [Gloeothece citriformis PCC 7424]|uniref:Beta sliding clamp n=1 Tax=Gloeothece citriformis (strain PCC 7424) TaxID=65393 RepID=B7KBY5_GLOC7|nr:DNA polymerase III subunit beta [Gloeothece citriformis]ACK68808.1 DNA polymerase III, beta subunit [Gloeothece citriformis PCC 7424]